MITTFSIWWLRRTRKTVLLNFEVTGGVLASRGNETYIFDNNIEDTLFITSDGVNYHVPDGHFQIVRRRSND